MSEIKRIITNRKARHEYELLDRYKAGIVLKGTEVKSIRDSKVSIAESYAKVDENEEIYIYDMHISPYKDGTYTNHEPKRPRKLLLNKREIKKIAGKTRQTRMTVIPTKMYFNERGIAKLEIALARGKRLYDKREKIREREDQKRIRQILKRPR